MPRLGEITYKRRLSENVVHIDVYAPLIAKKAEPGQFVILRALERGERIPLTVAKTNSENGTITLIFQEVGKTTLALGTLNVGDSLRDIVGPLGNPTPIKKYGNVAVVAGGLGTAEMLPIARAMRQSGNYVISIVGARRADLLILVDEMREVSDELIITTDDGSLGIKGVVTDPLRNLINEGQVDFVITCGPVIMMKFVAQITKEKKIPTYASLNPIMVDGTGMCGACRLNLDGETKFACVDGPDFDAHRVDFDELMMRQKAFVEFEKCALEKWISENRHKLPPEHPLIKHSIRSNPYG